jgi:hypothetical protein
LLRSNSVELYVYLRITEPEPEKLKDPDIVSLNFISRIVCFFNLCIDFVKRSHNQLCKEIADLFLEIPNIVSTIAFGGIL